jgi:predicted HicB family RNase H-like nuclease
MATAAVSESASGKTTIRIDGRTRARLAAAAEADRRPVSSLVRLLVEDVVADWEREDEQCR